MADNSLITQEQYNKDMKRFYDEKIYPYLNGSANLGFTPIGTVISVMSNEAPDNYLICDGTAYNISDYSDLANFFEEQFGSKNYFGGNGTTTFAVPDLRGEFLRGTGTNSHTNQGSGANVGVHQNATVIPLNRAVEGSTRIEVSRGNTSNYDSAFLNGDNNINVTGSVGSSAYSYTTRPTNTSVLYCIAYKNIYISAGVGGYPVEVTNLQDKQGLQFDATNNKWVNGDDYHVYSTEEHVVGKWIDGRNVYERTFQFLKSNLASGNNSLNHSISNIDLMWMNLNASFLKESTYNEIWNFSSWNGETVYDFKVCVLNCSATKINFYIGSNVFDRMTSSDYVIATIRYIKTTS